MATLEEIVVQLTAETSQLRAEMSSAVKVTEDASKRMESAIRDFTDKSSKNTSFFQSAMATMTGFLGSEAVLGVVEKVKEGFAELGHQLAEGVADANSEEDAMKRLATNLALSGKYSASAAEGLREFAGDMEHLTGIQDHVIISNMAVLSSLTKLSGDGLQKAEKAALDLSAAVGIDLDSATRMIAKGIEGNVAAFQRYGITLQKGRNETENFANVVGGLEKQFAGAASGSMQTFSGGILNLQNSFHNFVEVIGRVITNNEALKAVIAAVSDIFSGLEKETAKSADTLSGGFTSAINATITGLEIFLGTLSKIDDTLKLLYEGLMTSVNFLNDFYTAAGRIATLDFDHIGDSFKNTGDHIDEVNKIVSGQSINIFDTLNNKLIDVGIKAEDAGSKQTKAFTDATPAVKAHGVAIDDLVTKFYNFRQAAQDSQDSYVKGLLDQSAAFNGFNTLQQDALQASYDANLTSFNDYASQKMLLLDQQQQAEQALLQSYRDSGAITALQYENSLSAMQQKQGTDRVKTESELHKTRIDNLKSTFGTIASLQDSSSKELAAIGKAAAIANATIDGYAAVQKALAAAPPPFNFALAATVGVATAANVAKIAGVGLKTGIDEVPGQGTQDNFPAVLAPGERVVPAKTNQDLKAFLDDQNGGGGGSKQDIIINMNFSSIVAPTREQVSIIIEAINDTLAANASLRILGT